MLEKKHNKKKILIITIIAFIVIFFSLYLINNKGKIKLKGEVGDFVVKNDNIEFTIKNYDENTGFNILDSKQIIMKINFNEASTKKIKILLDEGLSYRSYPVLEYTKNDVNYKYMQSKIEENDTLRSAIEHVEAPLIINNELGSIQDIDVTSTGELVYTINSDIDMVEIPINIKVDLYKYYGKTEILNAIKIFVIEDEKEKEILNQNIKLASEGFYSKGYTKYSYYVPSKLLSGDLGITLYGRFVSSFYYNGSTSAKQVPTYFKKMIYTIYYPEETSFEGIVGYTKEDNDIINSYLNNRKIEVASNDSKHMATITINDNIKFKNGIAIKYKVNDNASPGSKTAPSKDSITMTFYDGNEETFENQNYGILRIDVLNKDDIKNELSVTLNNTYDDNNDNTYVTGPFFLLENNTPTEKTNQTLEYDIDENYNVIKLTFPKMAEASYTNLKYRITGDLKEKDGEEFWREADVSNIINNEFQADRVCDGNINCYITAAKVTVSSYPRNYVSSNASSKGEGNAILYGNLKKDSGETAKVVFKVYDENNKSNIIIKEGYVQRTNTFTVTPGSVSYQTTAFTEKDKYSARISSVQTNQEFSLKAYLRLNTYPYGNSMHLPNTVIYIRQPKKIKINTNSINIVGGFGDENTLNKVNYTITEGKNSSGDIIYKLETNFTIGNFLGRDLLSKYLKITFNLKVDIDSDDTSLSINDLVAFGSANNNYSAGNVNTIKDVYDFDLDNDTDERILVPINSSTISILPSKSVIIAPRIESNGEEKSFYNEDDTSTIIDVNSTDKINYNVHVKNNTSEQINEFKLYVPVPKKGVNYGLNYQNEAFSWNIDFESIIIPKEFEVSYSTSNDANVDNMNFVKTLPEDLSKITMIKLEAKTPLIIGYDDYVKIKLKVKNSRKTDDKKINIYNSVYKMTTENISGLFQSDKTAIKLNTQEISGLIFDDKNANGIFDDEDSVLKDIKLDLYKYNDEEKNYEKMENAEFKIDKATGEFYFETDDFNPKENYAIKYEFKNNYYPIYKVCEEEICNKADITGWIKNINSLNGFNNNIGLINYVLNFDVNDLIITELGETKIELENIFPNYFDDIKAVENAFEFELVNNSDYDYVEIIQNNTKELILKSKDFKNDIKVKARINDIYGNKKEKIFNVDIVQNLENKLYALDIILYVGDEIKYESYAFNAKDYKDREIKLIYNGENKNISYVSNVPQKNGKATTKGEYYITYKLEHNNLITEKTIKVTVKEHLVTTTTKNIINILNPATSTDIKYTLIIYLSMFLLVGLSVTLIQKFIKNKN